MVMGYSVAVRGENTMADNTLSAGAGVSGGVLPDAVAGSMFRRRWRGR